MTYFDRTKPKLHKPSYQPLPTTSDSQSPRAFMHYFHELFCFKFGHVLFQEENLFLGFNRGSNWFRDAGKPRPREVKG